MYEESPENNCREVNSKLKSLKNSGKIWKAEEYNHKLSPELYWLRLAIDEDSTSLAKLYLESFPEYPYTKLHTTQYHMENMRNENLVRIVKKNKSGELIGAGALEVNPPCKLGEIKQVVVHPKYRGHGLSLPLVAVLTEIAEDIGLEKVYMEVRTRIPAMQRTALNLGYKPVTIEYGQYIVYHKDKVVRENMILMVKFLNEGEVRIDKKDNIMPEMRTALLKNLMCQINILSYRS